MTSKESVVQGERRKQPRVAKRVEGKWRGASGAMRCTVGDISMAGCYVHGMSSPAHDEATIVTIEFAPGNAISLPARVVYTDRGMGFAVRFDNLPEVVREHLANLLEEFKEETATP